MKNVGPMAMELASEVGGGALAGLIDVETPTKMPLGLPVGAWVGLGLAAAGVFGAGGKHEKAAKVAGDIGGGMLAFEAGTAVVARVLKLKLSAPATPAAGTVSGLPGHQGGSLSADVLRAQINQRVAAMQQNRRAA